jgi:hypothetical protein
MLGQNAFGLSPVLREESAFLLEIGTKIGGHPGMEALAMLFSLPWFFHV